MDNFENAALFLRLGLSSTLIPHENGAFRKRIQTGNENVGFSFSCWLFGHFVISVLSTAVTV